MHFVEADTLDGSTPARVSVAGSVSLTDSESEDLELSPWDTDAPKAPTSKYQKRPTKMTDRLTLADRVVMDPTGRAGVVVSREDKKLADALVVRNLAINACFIGLWYIFSLLISIYNKWMFDPKHLNFHFPLFVTCGHMIVQFSLASLVLFAFPQLRPGSHKEGTSTERQKQQAGEMTLWFYLTRVGPCGAATGLDIGLGNMSLKFITLAFYTMCKSSTLAFVLIFAFIFRLEKPTWVLVSIITTMTIGVIMMVASESETTFVLIGFILVLTASALSGLRWSLTQVLLVRNPATSNPFSTIFFLAPVMFLSILCVAVPVEGFGPLFTRFGELSSEWGLISALVIVVCPGIIAFLMVASEFALLQRSSVVTLSVAGIFKEIITISAATIIFGDPLTPVNISGLVITIVSIGWYNWWKIQKMRAETLGETTHGSVGANGGYVAVGEEDVDTDVDENGNSEDRDERDGARRKRRSIKRRVKERTQNKQGLGGKGKATATLHDQLLPSVSECDNGNSAKTEETEDRDSSPIGKQDVIPSGSTA